MPSLPHVLAHAEPSAATYHVYCPACAGWVGGAVARAYGLDLWAVSCPRCGSAAPGRVQPDHVLPFGPYSGRTVSSLRTPAGRDYLDSLLQAPLAAPGTVPPQDLRLAILWHLGWLSAERAQVPAGPNLGRLRAEWNEWLRRETAAASDSETAGAVPVNEPERARAERQAARRASWVRHVQAEQQRLRGGRAARPQQFHEYQPPLEPLSPVEEFDAGPWSEFESDAPEWAQALGLPWPASAEQVRRAYRRLSKRHHPDAGGSEAAMQRINQARDEAGVWLRTEADSVR